MNINEIKMGMGGISTEGKIIAKSNARRVRTRYGQRSVTDAELEDETGTINLSLWEQQIDAVNIGDIVKIEGAYVTEFNAKLQLNIPRSGLLEVKSKGPVDDAFKI